MTLLPDAPWRRAPGLATIIAALGGPAQTLLVGGAVRDGLLRLPVSDIDLATRLTPDVVIAQLEAAGIKAVPTGLAHGTITAVSAETVAEVTTLRRDVATDGRHATIAFTEDWREDAARRDFTINALFADPVTGEVFDAFGGLDDLAARRVRFIGAPLDRIAEDHLRILRFFRFHARFGAGDPDLPALAACVARANDLMALSRERIADELLKLLGAANPVPVLEIMVAQGVLAPVLPEVDEHRVERLTNLVALEVACELPIEPLRRLIALLPDDPAIAYDIAVRLRLPNASRKRVAVAKSGQIPDAATIRAVTYHVGLRAAIDRLTTRGADADHVRSALAAVQGWDPPKLPISGGALIKRGLIAGPVVAETLNAIETAWVDGGFPSGPDFDAIVTRALQASEACT